MTCFCIMRYSYEVSVVVYLLFIQQQELESVASPSVVTKSKFEYQLPRAVQQTKLSDELFQQQNLRLKIGTSYLFCSISMQHFTVLITVFLVTFFIVRCYDLFLDARKTVNPLVLGCCYNLGNFLAKAFQIYSFSVSNLFLTILRLNCSLQCQTPLPITLNILLLVLNFL